MRACEAVREGCYIELSRVLGLGIPRGILLEDNNGSNVGSSELRMTGLRGGMQGQQVKKSHYEAMSWEELYVQWMLS